MGVAAPQHGLADIAEKVEAGERLSFDDGVALYDSPDIHTLGYLANLVRERRHGRSAYYNVNRHINYTNYCVLRCKFCGFYRPFPSKSQQVQESVTGSGSLRMLDAVADAPVGGYELSIEQVVEQAGLAYDQGASEVHIVGGLHPRLPFDYYLDMCRGIRQRCPKIHIKAFTAIEIIHFTRVARPRLSVSEVLTQLREAGLDSLPGGGAEIFDDRVHDEAFKNKVGETEWFEVHAKAHELGIYSNATMLYGHVETPAERIGHLVKLRQHQDESIRSRQARFNCLIPLSFIPEGSALADRPGPTGLDDLKTLAIGRLMLDNFDHIKAFWIMQSPKLAQVSLNWGVDDIDGTVVYYDITKREGTGGDATHQELSVDKLKRLIREADCVPVERDSLYRPIVRQGTTWHIEGE
ncbi:MAG: CofH family radical SAM protein [Phycisphaerae bacterium]